MTDAMAGHEVGLTNYVLRQLSYLKEVAFSRFLIIP
jgi:hypothetical protein